MGWAWQQKRRCRLRLLSQHCRQAAGCFIGTRLWNWAESVCYVTVPLVWLQSRHFLSPFYNTRPFEACFLALPKQLSSNSKGGTLDNVKGGPKKTNRSNFIFLISRAQFIFGPPFIVYNIHSCSGSGKLPVLPLTYIIMDLFRSQVMLWNSL